MATITTKYNFGDTVYLSTDPEQLPRLVTGFDCRPYGLFYQLSSGTSASSHYDFEITSEKNVLKVIDAIDTEE